MDTLLLDPPARRPCGLPGTDTAVAAGAFQVAPVPGPAPVTSAPARTAATPLGTIAYRMTGTGSPLLLVMGFGGSIATWDPRFVDALAARHRVVTFNNAGIGGTSPIAEPLSIAGMAEQTSALVTALGLGRVDVLGWSMGSTIAAALAALHPEQVRRLVLAAGWPGDGSTERPSHEAIDDFFAKSKKGTASPPADGQQGAANGVPAAAAGDPAGPPAPHSVVSAQAKALVRWWAGRDHAGQRLSSITAPTLVAGGTDDSLVPVANSHVMAGLIPGARLVLYPGGQHEFLFRQQASFIPAVESFLAGAGR
jgi:pimeloyl-ACP methyl ester carboxylesterase